MAYSEPKPPVGVFYLLASFTPAILRLPFLLLAEIPAAAILAAGIGNGSFCHQAIRSAADFSPERLMSRCGWRCRGSSSVADIQFFRQMSLPLGMAARVPPLKGPCGQVKTAGPALVICGLLMLSI